MKRIKIYPCPNVEIRLHVSEQMKEDIRACRRMAELAEDGKDCETCSWWGVEFDNTCFCEWPIVREKLICDISDREKLAYTE